ncbi:hypothetical protein CXB51_025989 [Gossypium anomalum]|uniref:Uncharacterized protein n=1 Tax=Gossypium anomalum TaxID=47600 RepID=A0A8J6CN72_9ROSI|nr:hypothetical protein CXB51_025989 [Gossypium anomalum]
MSSIIEGNSKEDEEFKVHYPVFPMESTQAVIPCDDDGEGQQPAAGGRGNEVNAETMVNKLMVNKIINQLGAETIDREDEMEKELERETEQNLKLIQVINEEDQLFHWNARLRLEFERQREQINQKNNCCTRMRG